LYTKRIKKKTITVAIVLSLLPIAPTLLVGGLWLSSFNQQIQLFGRYWITGIEIKKILDYYINLLDKLI
jgi:hypothetical protein